jgi:hypothetical protein
VGPSGTSGTERDSKTFLEFGNAVAKSIMDCEGGTAPHSLRR